MACGECDTLRRQVRELREELAEFQKYEDSESPLVFSLKKALRLRPQSAKILAALMDRQDKVVKVDLLIDASEYEGEAGNPNDRRFRAIIGVNLARIRRSMEDARIEGAVQTFYGNGYMISKSVADQVRALL